jgi:hypothetical protein
MMFIVPLYFQVTMSAKPSIAGLYLVPAVVGNTVGGLACGSFVRKTGKYKLPTSIAAIVSALCHALIMVRWTGHTSSLESLYIFPGGLGTGISHSSTFIALQAATNEEEMAIATGGLYLFGNFGAMMGVSMASGVVRLVVEQVAQSGLQRDGFGAGEIKEIVEKALTDIGFVETLTGRARGDVVDAYVAASRANFGEPLFIRPPQNPAY